MEFICEPEVRRNPSGEIQWVKVRWTEAREITEWAIEGLGDNLFYFGPIAFGLSMLPAVAFQMAGFAVAGGVIMIASMALAILLWRRLPRMSGRERVLVFTRDGKMRAPLGLSAGRLPNGESRHPHTGIQSIEARHLVKPGPAATTTYTHGVVAFYSSGAMNQLAEWLTPEQAHLLAVVLMSGVKELHDDLTASPGQRREGSNRRRIVD